MACSAEVEAAAAAAAAEEEAAAVAAAWTEEEAKKAIASLKDAPFPAPPPPGLRRGTFSGASGWFGRVASAARVHNLTASYELL